MASKIETYSGMKQPLKKKVDKIETYSGMKQKLRKKPVATAAAKARK